MTVQNPARETLRSAPQSPSIGFHAEERAILRAVKLRALTALDQMYAYWGSDRA